MTGHLILLNGASSSGKTSLARALQDALPEAWLLFGIDDFVNALPPRLKSPEDQSPEGIDFAPDGSVQIGETFRVLEHAWMKGIAATVRAGVNVIVDDVLLSGHAGQQRWNAALDDLPAFWLGVMCSLEVGEVRESQRPERVAGMHRQQAALVHQGVQYDLTVDTTASSAAELAQHITKHLKELPMPYLIREATDADFPAIAALLTAVYPQHPLSAETLAHDMKFFRESDVKPHIGQWLAVQDGEVVGFAEVIQYPGMFHPDRYHASVMVLPDQRGQGLGQALTKLLENHLRARGAREILAGAYEEDTAGVAFLTRRDFVEAKRYYDNVLDLNGVNVADWQTQMQTPAGVRAVSFAQLIQELGQDAATRAFYDCFALARADVPRTGEATELTYDDFRKRFESPDALPEGIFLAVTDAGEVVSLSELWQSDAGPERLNIGLTGTRREWRQQGLAQALKLRGMAFAQARGVTELWTGNATENKPMLALNDKLGFKPRPAYIEFKWGGVQ